ncbi:MAG: hypothetical protein ABL309_09400 [Phycisphaerales bacterium]
MSQERWFEDYRSAGLIEWPDGLRDDIRRELTQSRSRWLLLAALAVVAAVVGLGLAVLVAITPTLPLIATLPALAIAMFVPCFATTHAEDHRERWKSAKASMKDGDLELFERLGRESSPRQFVLIAPSREILVLDSEQDELILQPCSGLTTHTSEQAVGAPA